MDIHLIYVPLTHFGSFVLYVIYYVHYKLLRTYKALQTESMVTCISSFSSVMELEQLILGLLPLHIVLEVIPCGIMGYFGS